LISGDPPAWVLGVGLTTPKRKKINFLPIQNHWVSGFCPLTFILKTRKHNIPETGAVSEMLFFFNF
jgi:hypothetical protein